MVAILAIGLTHGGDILAVATSPVGGCAVRCGRSRVDYLGREAYYWFIGLAGKDDGDGRVKLVGKHRIQK